MPDLDTDKPDLGRVEIIGKGYERAFKVPTLRNVALTAPYMHNGKFKTLADVIDFYSGGGGAAHGIKQELLDDKIRPFDINDTEKNDLIAFLHTLTDESNKPTIPGSVPSGLSVVEPLENQSLELAGFKQFVTEKKQTDLKRVGKRIYVRTGQTIQDGIDLAQPGDSVMVELGIYHETLAIDKSDITIMGIEKNGRLPILDGKNILSDAAVGSGSNIELRGIIARDFTSNGLMLNHATNVTFRDVACHNTGLYGIYPVECVGVLIENCTVTGVRDAAL